jgi:Holliday junction resolvase
MSRFSRDKGARTERGIVDVMQEAGFAAQRIPLSGAAGGKFAGDVTMPLLGKDEVFEVKCRAEGFKFLYASLAEHCGLVVKADHKAALMVIPLDRFLEIAIKAEGNKPAETTL